MAFPAVWRALCDRCSSLDPASALVTPATERPFTVESTASNRIDVRYLESDADRALWRDQFEVLVDHLDDEPLDYDDLAPGVEPYVSVLSLLPRYEVDESARVLERATAGESGDATGSPFLRERWEVRTTPERVHDDALLLADFLARHDADDREEMAVDSLVDLYVLLSDVQRESDRLRRDVGDDLLPYIGPDDRLSGRFGTVTRTVRERRRPKDDATVLDALDEHGIPHEWVLGIDQSKLDVVLAVTDLDAEAVYDVDEQVYVQKTGVEEAEKHAHLQGLRDRLADVDEAEADELLAEIDSIEDRLDSLLATA